MSRLLARGLTAALAPQFAPNIDILVTSPNGTLLKSVQVKTSRNPRNWRFSRKAEALAHSNLYYCLVHLNQAQEFQDTVYVVPSKLIASLVATSHSTWLAGTKANGAPRKDSAIREVKSDFTAVFGPDTDYGLGWMDEFKEAWHLLALVDRATHVERSP